MDLSNDATFDRLVLLCFFAGLAYIGATFHVLKNRGYDTKSQKFGISVALSSFPILMLPFWLKSGLPWQFKVFVPIFAGVIGVVYYLRIVRIRNLFKK